MKLLAFKKLHEDAIFPSKANPNDCCYDLTANDDVFIEKGSTGIISTGLAVNLPPGKMIKILDRSSIALKGLLIGGGVIDPDFQGEIKIILHNLNNIEHIEYGPTYGYKISKGQRIAQFCIINVEYPEIVEIVSLEETQRDTKGFGSSNP